MTTEDNGLGLDPEKLEKFKAVNNAVIAWFGLEPQWKIDVHILSNEDYLENYEGEACVTWAPHYREATIRTRIEVFEGPLDQWVYYLVHELFHLKFGALHDYIRDISGKHLIHQTQDMMETSVSEFTNMVYPTVLERVSDIM